MWSWSYRTDKTNVISQYSSMQWLCHSHMVQRSKTVQASMSDSFITSPPIILMFTLSAQAFLGSFEHEKAFCYGRYGGGQRGTGVWTTRSRAKDFTWREKYVRKSKPVSACMNISASASVQVWARSFVHLNNCLPESETEWHSCSKRTPTGSGICSRGRGKKLFAHCSQFLRRKKVSLRNQVQFHHRSQSRGVR